MRALVLQHVDLNPAGIWAEALDAAGVTVAVARPDRDGVPEHLGEYDLLLALGGPQSACPDASPPWLDDEVEAIGAAVRDGMPFLGVCLGAQMLARALGGRVRPAAAFDLGLFDVRPSRAGAVDPVLGPAGGSLTAFAFHGDAFGVPAGGTHLAFSPGCATEAVRFAQRADGLQFHLEASLDDVAAWLDLLPDADGHPTLRRAGGRDAWLEQYARRVPALRDAAVGIAWRWLATAQRRRTRIPTPTVTRS